MTSYKELISSALLTFFATMAIVIVPEIDSLTMDSFTDGTFWGLIFASVRTGLKVLLQVFVAWYKAR